MIRIFQALDALGEQKVLLLAVNELDIIPNIGEELSINEKDFVILSVKHCLVTPALESSIELTVVPPELLVEIKYVGEQEYDY